MSSYYLPKKLSDYLDRKGGRSYLAKLVERDMAGYMPVGVCPKCHRRRKIGASVCWHCGHKYD